MKYLKVDGCEQVDEQVQPVGRPGHLGGAGQEELQRDRELRGAGDPWNDDGHPAPPTVVLAYLSVRPIYRYFPLKSLLLLLSYDLAR